MSLHSEPVGPIPEETVRVARAAFSHGTVWTRLRDGLGVIHGDAAFAPLFSHRGRPAEAPWRLALVSVMPFAEDLSDRQAAEAVRGGSTGSTCWAWSRPIPASSRRCSWSSAPD